MTIKKKIIDPYAKMKKIPKQVFEISNWDIPVFKDFPYRAKEGEMPFKVLRMKQVKYFETVIE